MYIKRNISLKLVLRYAWIVILQSFLWSSLIFILYHFLGWHFIAIPFQPLSVIGIAVAFFTGFKNNQSYDRFWEARKIWGGIVNTSRTWTNQVLNLISLEDNEESTDSKTPKVSIKELKEHQKILVYRHIAWINALRLQLRQPSSFSFKENKFVETLFDKHRENEFICETTGIYIPNEENEDLKKRQNVATHLVKNQAIHLKEIKEKYKLMDGFDFSLLMNNLEELYNLQGKCERIKNTPFPRQYAYFSKVFTYIFIFLVPFGLLDVFAGQIKSENLSSVYMFLIVPVSILISWIFVTWEVVGNNSEDPFENKINDVPMSALCRTIEIDLKDMLDQTDLPPKLQPKDNILY